MDEKERSSALEVADQIITLVKANPVGGGRGDAAGFLMHGAYLRALRRFERIRQMAAQGAADETLILTRSLLSLVARAAWVDQPSESVERRNRWERLAKRQLTDRIAMHEAMVQHGFAVDEAGVEQDRAQLESLRQASNLPNDRALLDDLGLGIWYDRLYRFGSDYVHFSLAVGIEELRGGEETHYESEQPELAHEGLCLAVLLYGTFLECAEKTMQHGLIPEIFNITSSSPAFAHGSLE